MQAAVIVQVCWQPGMFVTRCLVEEVVEETGFSILQALTLVRVSPD